MIKYKEGDSWKDAVLDYYPVGALYFSFSNTSPANLFGGSWSLLDSAGRFIGVYGVNSSGANVPAGQWGGSTFIANQHLPPHSHKFYYKDNSGSYSGMGFYSSHFETNPNFHFWGFNDKFGMVGYLDEHLYLGTGGGAITQKDYYPAYYGAYIWERVA